MSDRRYRQRDYRGGGGGPSERRDPPRPAVGTFGILRSRPTSRCAACSFVLPITADSLTQCPQCRADLHACRQCAHFDSARRSQCSQDVPAPIEDKRAANDCPRFSLMVTVERDTSGGSVRPVDARRSFGNLFRK